MRSQVCGKERWERKMGKRGLNTKDLRPTYTTRISSEVLISFNLSEWLKVLEFLGFHDPEEPRQFSVRSLVEERDSMNVG